MQRRERAASEFEASQARRARIVAEAVAGEGVDGLLEVDRLGNSLEVSPQSSMDLAISLFMQPGLWVMKNSSLSLLTLRRALLTSSSSKKVSTERVSARMAPRSYLLILGLSSDFLYRR